MAAPRPYAINIPQQGYYLIPPLQQNNVWLPPSSSNGQQMLMYQNTNNRQFREVENHQLVSEPLNQRAESRIEKHTNTQPKKHEAKESKWVQNYKKGYSHPENIDSSKGHMRKVRDADFSSNGSTCSNDKKAESRIEKHTNTQPKKHEAKESKWVQNYKKGYSHPENINSSKGHMRKVRDADFSSNGSTCSNDKKAESSIEKHTNTQPKKHEARESKCIQNYKKGYSHPENMNSSKSHMKKVRDADFSSNGSTCSNDKKAESRIEKHNNTQPKKHEAKESKCIQNFKKGYSHPENINSSKGHMRKVRDADFSSNGSTCSNDKKAESSIEKHTNTQPKKHEARESKCIQNYKKGYSHPENINSSKGHMRKVRDADFSSNGSTCSNDDPGSTSTGNREGNESSSNEGNIASNSKSLYRRQKQNSTRVFPQQHQQKGFNKNANNVCKHRKIKNGLRENELYDFLIDFTLQPDQMFRNGYPKLNEQNEVQILKQYFPVPYLRKKFDSDSKNFISSESCQCNELGKSSLASDKTAAVERTCVRCNTRFFITENEYLTKNRCNYHWGRYLNNTFSCCNMSVGSAGCTFSKYHVWDGTIDGLNNKLEGFVKTKKSSRNRKRKVYALDCEMCYTVKGLELCKVTILEYNGRVVYDHFVKPDYEVVDYNTRYSGVTESDIYSFNSKSFSEVQRDLLGLINEEAILLGHSLHNDIRVLKLLHSKVVDISLLFPHPHGHPYKYSLKYLMLTHLNEQMQPSDNSVEKALNCLKLIFHKIQE